ncbi:peptidoglycan recognition protein [Kineosporia sp. J2-2]|uniref:Peptidoglycan recognition protein n=1 Tax=Kineosporia corallincola TaxID=2835133 RepID=A0ABS5THK6_9ACTN|nr:peptidoglycan recognition protein [Kineosporia corallincola]MBT0770348.1 peptidoglycan recognition protein [Kineosporia corallincola]
MLSALLALAAPAPAHALVPPDETGGAVTEPTAVAPTVTKLALGQAISTAGVKPVVLTAKRPTGRFQTVGVTWKGRDLTPDLEISVRTRHEGTWSGWEHLDGDAGDDVVATRDVRGGTDPAWVGPSDGVQAKIVVRSGKLPDDLKLELVDPGSSGYDQVAAGIQGAAAGTPTVVTRTQWGADESRVNCSPEYGSTIRAAVMHHTAGKNGYSASQVPAIIRGDYAYHLSRGWCDIGYNALVDRFGRIWEGRAGGLDRAVIGAHAGGFNTGTFGVAVIGNYDTARPSAAAVNAVARIFAWKLGRYHRDPKGSTRLTSAGGGTARYPAGRTVTLPVIMGHRNTGFTACPGRYLYPYLPSIRSRVTALMQAALINPTVPKTNVRQGDPLTVTARALRRQSWRLDVEAPCNGGRVARVTGSVAAGEEITATWDGRVAGGATARPGRYTLTLTSSSHQGQATPVVKNVLITPAPQPAPPAATPSGGAGGYVPLTPARIYDSRTGNGLGPGGHARIPVLGQAGVPAAGVTAVVLDLTASCSTEATALTVYPTGRTSARPVAGVAAGVTRSTLVTTRVGADGSVSVGNARGVTELTADVVGYYTESGTPLTAVEGTRILREPVTGTRTVTLPATLGGIPAGQIGAVLVDVSVIQPGGAGTLTAGPGELPTLVFRKGESVDDLAVVPVVNGQLTLSNPGAAVEAVLDVRGVVAATATGRFTPVKPTLLTDATLQQGRPKKLTVPEPATAVLLTLTADRPGSDTALDVYPWGGLPTGTAALRVGQGDTRSNQVLVPVGEAGAVTLLNSVGATGVRVDVIGYVR